VVRLGSIPRQFKTACLVVCFAAVCFATMSGAMFAQQQQSETANEKTVLRGVVVNSVTHQPVGRALVKSTDGRFATMTNDRGQFEMRFKEKKSGPGNGGAAGSPGAWFAASSDGAGGLSVSQGDGPRGPTSSQQGQVQQGQGQQGQGQSMVDRPDFLTAVRVGYLTPQTSWGSAVAVARDQEEVTIALTPEAKVVGHVMLADGEAAAGITLELLRQVLQDGRVRWNSAGTAEARSDGEFRFANLEAGIYKLYSAELPDRDPVTSDPRAQEGWGYPPDYYPSAADFAGGAAIHLTAGETFQATLTPQERRYYAVHIGVVGGSKGQLDVDVERDGHPGPGFSLGYNFRDGSIAGMLPDGNYLVRASTQDNSGPTGLVNLSVHGGPATGMVTLLGGTNIDVRVIKELDESAASHYSMTINAGPRGVSNLPVMLQLVPAEEFNTGRGYTALQSSDPSAEGLVISGVPAGEYRVTTQMPGGYVAAIRCGDKDLLESTLVVGGGTSMPPIEVTLRNDGAEIDGSIVELAKRGTGDGYPPAGFVYVVPVGSARGMSLLVAQPNGDFQATQLAPGTYRVLAFERPKNDLEYADEDVMRKYEAQMVTVLAGQKEKIRVSLNAE
jgi:hypothetical protein